MRGDNLDGLLIGKGTATTISKITAKHDRQKESAGRYLKNFAPHFTFWSPVVRPGIVAELEQIDGLELFINGKYREAVHRLQERAK